MRRNMVVAVVIFLLALLASSVAWAHGSRGHHGNHHSRAQVGVDIIIGAPVWHYRTYPRYYAQQQAYIYSYPPVIAMQSSPPVFIERGDEQSLNQTPQAFWYYCDNPQGYYPNVNSCPSGWRPVPAQPPTTP